METLMSPTTDERHLTAGSVTIGLNAVIVAVTGESPRVLTISGSRHGLKGQEELDALPFGPLDPDKDRTLERGLRGWIREQTGLEIGYAEQLYTFGDRHRDPSERAGGPRVVSIAYLALVREKELVYPEGVHWRECYSFLPWEDWRQERPAILTEVIIPALKEWAGSSKGLLGDRTRERLAIAFGLEGIRWDAEKVLERYELLYEAGLVVEARSDPGRSGDSSKRPQVGTSMALDHRRMLATALGRLRGKIKYRPVVFELLPPSFTLLRLQRVVEALAGMRLHKQNFRRLVDRGGLVEGTGRIKHRTGGRPAELFRFRREVLRERRAPGVGIPGG